MRRWTCVPVVAIGPAIGFVGKTKGAGVGVQLGGGRGRGDLFTGRPLESQAKMRDVHVSIAAWNQRSV